MDLHGNIHKCPMRIKMTTPLLKIIFLPEYFNTVFHIPGKAWIGLSSRVAILEKSKRAQYEYVQANNFWFWENFLEGKCYGLWYKYIQKYQLDWISRSGSRRNSRSLLENGNELICIRTIFRLHRRGGGVVKRQFFILR